MSSVLGIEGLSQDRINELLAASRQKGEYNRQAVNFLESDEMGVEVSLTEGPFATKKPGSVNTGFKSAFERIAEGKLEGLSDEIKQAARNARVIVNEERIYLVKQQMAEAAAE